MSEREKGRSFKEVLEAEKHKRGVKESASESGSEPRPGEVHDAADRSARLEQAALRGTLGVSKDAAAQERIRAGLRAYSKEKATKEKKE